MMTTETNHASTEVVMNHQQMAKPALIAVAVLVALVIAGLPVGYLGFGLLILACPLMMFFMMRGMDHGGHGDAGDDEMHAGHRHLDQR
ncbi:MAG: DUF2933 domain-containing protein [Acidimicrobiia bacterium]|nr:DUF2933 domain-containing protein [Acidimicrobiia bacterium]